ncbi:MAG: hypothetical protein J2P59_04210 [Acidimicrobiales bacterium]|nr:hypothetical protein [Acidimicrobiales bacterium]
MIGTSLRTVRRLREEVIEGVGVTGTGSRLVTGTALGGVHPIAKGLGSIPAPHRLHGLSIPARLTS